jgi:predicted NUDIX family NTP pyrophosphohydrolase
MYRRTGYRLQVLLVHPGGPFWRNKNKGAWSIPKGEMADGEDAAAAARREFQEETGCELSGLLEPLGDIRQRGGKRVTAFAIEGDLDVRAIKSNTFEIEWPPKSGKMQSFPEVDRAAWFDLPAAHVKILESQRCFSIGSSTRVQVPPLLVIFDDYHLGTRGRRGAIHPPGVRVVLSAPIVHQ